MAAKVPVIQWDSRNEGHLGDRDRCSKNQIEDILIGRCHSSKKADFTKDQEPRVVYTGQTCGGRYLVVIAVRVGIGILRPISCYPPNDKGLRIYEDWKRSLPR